jgi:hypothetical protein
MTQYAFDAAGFATFDLAEGTIRSENNEQLTMIPLSLISKLPESGAFLNEAKEWGFKRGKVLLTVLDSGLDKEMDVLADHLAGELAVMGFGRIAVKLYGDALLFNVTASDSELFTASVKSLVANFLKGYIKALMPSFDFEIIPIAQEQRSVLFFMGNEVAINRVQSDIKEGISAMSAIERLMEKG